MLRERYRAHARILLGAFAGSLALLLGLVTWGSLAQSASLTATPTTPRQNDTVTLIGAGFSPGETVSVWITYPNMAVYGVAEIVASGDGAFNFPYLPDFLGATFTPTGRYTYTAFGQNSGREVYATIDVAIGAAPGTSAGVTLTAEPGGDSQGGYYIFRGSGYKAGEDAAVWLRYPDNRVEDLGMTEVGADGRVEYVAYMGGAPVGRYALTIRGLEGGANGIAEFDLRVDDLTQEAGQAALAVGPSPDNQRSTAVFTGSGFRPRELVTIWVTLPDYSTLWIGDVTADGTGAFSASLYLSEQEPVGLRTYTAYGNTSGLQGTAAYTLQPGSSPTAAPAAAPTIAPAALTPVPDIACEGAGCFAP